MAKEINYEYALDSMGARFDTANKRLFIVIIVLVVTLIGTNLGWLYYESQMDTISIEAEQRAEGHGNNYVIGGDYGGQTESSDN